MYRANQTQHERRIPVKEQQRYSISGGFGAKRIPLYPVGPTISQSEFGQIRRGFSPSPYLNRQGMRPPSYEEWQVHKAESALSRNNASYEEREKRILERNEREIEEEKRRREQLRTSFEREISALTQKQGKNLQNKQKLLAEIQNLQSVHDQLHTKLMSQVAPPASIEMHESVDRKQQEMIVLKNRLVANMRDNETQLNKQREEEENYWQEQIAQKEKILFRLEQNSREKRLELHSEKQKSLEKPDFLMIEEEVRMAQYADFIDQYELLEQKIKRLVDERSQSAREVSDSLHESKTKLKEQASARADLQSQLTSARLRVDELQRVSIEMEAANHNLLQQVDRKEKMIEKYELDIHELKQKKAVTEAEITQLIQEARDPNYKLDALDQMGDLVSKFQEDLKFEQARNGKLKNQYQRLYQLLCSSASKNIHQTFNETLAV